jgi:hypothetical protein
MVVGSMLGRLQPRQKIEAGVTANVLLSLIDRMKNESPLSKRYLWFEANAYNAHGRLAFAEGTEESARRAVAHFEKELEVSEAIGCVVGIVDAKRNIVLAKSIYEMTIVRSCWRHPENCTNCVLLNWGKRTNSQFVQVQTMLVDFVKPTVGMRQGNY